MEALFEDHIKTRMDLLEQVLPLFELEGLIIGAGTEGYHYQDDQAFPFRANHHFRHYCPLEGAGHAIVLAPGQKPLLCHFRPDDFWYEHTELGNPFWANAFEVRSFGKQESLWKALSAYPSYAYLGPEQDKAEKAGLKAAPEAFEHHINWYRAYKSPYEVACIERATEIAVRGHKAARDVFLKGGAEYDIHMAYLAATRLKDVDLPYTGIVGVNEKAAILHYEGKRQEPLNGRVMLIDSGAQFNGYASDITRTHASRQAEPAFHSMLEAMDKEQQALCDGIQAGMNYGELFHQSHLAVARVLLEHGLLLGVDASEAVEEGLTEVFYPHGVSHMLGIQVHDAGSKQLDLEGAMWEKDKQHPTRTVMRSVEPGHVFTVEPGLYFIEMLLDPQREGENRGFFNWRLIDQMIPHGGIRIEDNIHVTNDGADNLTRPHLP